jgi:hypothetical protein
MPLSFKTLTLILLAFMLLRSFLKKDDSQLSSITKDKKGIARKIPMLYLLKRESESASSRAIEGPVRLA